VGGLSDGSEIVVRPATAGDMPRVGHILAEGFGGKFRRIFGRRADRVPVILARMERLGLERGLSVLLVAEVSGVVVGVVELLQRRERLRELWEQFRIILQEVGLFSTLRSVIGITLLHSDVATGLTNGLAYISSLAVTAEYRGRGVGSTLLRGVERWAASWGKRGLSLHVAASNPARHLYERLGFRTRREIEERLTEWLFGIRTWVYMVKPLSEEEGSGE